MKITIEIETGNDAMQTGADVARAVKYYMPRILESVRDGGISGGRIMDDNGNSVGTWEIEN